jgi:hypothetical protein
MKRLSLYILTSTFILASCGGGGGDSPPAVIEPTFSFEAPTTLTDNSTPSSSGCTGTTWDDCIKLTATANDPQNRLITKEWRTYNSNSSNCEPYTRQGDNIISSPLYCGHNGYSCRYRYEWEFRDVTDEGDNFTNYYFQDINVNINAIACASASGANNSYIQDANIFVDLNRNFIQDNNEPFTTSGQLGQFTFDTPISDNSLLVLKGGIDSATGIEMPKNYTLLGFSRHNEKFIISPISSIAYFMGENFSPNDSLGIKLFDIYKDDPITQLNSEEASYVLLTNIKISIIAETISKTLEQDDYLKIYQSMAKKMTDKELSLKDISSKELIYETIKDIDYQDTLDTTDEIYVSEKMNSFLDSIVIDESNEYLQKFERGLKTLPEDIKELLKNNEKL